MNFWNEALQILSSFVFECPFTNKRSVPPSVAQWIATLEGLCAESCIKKVSSMCVKEIQTKNHWKFFLAVFEVANGYRNVSPTCATFTKNF